MQNFILGILSGMARHRKFLVFFNISPLNTFDPQGGVEFDPRALINFMETHQIKLHAKLGSPRSYGFRQDCQRFQILLAPLDVGQRAYVMVRCPSICALTFSLNL